MARRKRNREAVVEAKTEDEVKTLARIDHLAEAVAERLSDSERARWTGLAVGLGFATLAGLISVAIYLFLRRNAGGSVVGGLGLANGNGNGQLPITIINQLPGVSGTKKKRKKDKKPASAVPSTFSGPAEDEELENPPREQLPPMTHVPDIPRRPVRLAPNAAIRVAAAGSSAWRLLLRVVGPPRTYATLGTDARALREGGQGVSVDVGQLQEVALEPGTVLYGTAASSNVAIVIVAAEQVQAVRAPLRIVR